MSQDAADCVCFNLRKATRSITHVYDAALRPSGLRATQFTVLNVIRRLAPAAGVTRIAAVAVIDRTTLTRSLALLARGGLIRLVPSSDPRERRYAVTVRGERALARATPLWQTAQTQVAKALGDSRLQRLLGDLDKVVKTGRAANAARAAASAGRP